MVCMELNIQKHNIAIVVVMSLTIFIGIIIHYYINIGFTEMRAQSPLIGNEVIFLLIEISILGSCGTVYFALRTHYLLLQFEKQKQSLYEVQRQSDIDVVSGLKNRNALTRFAQEVDMQNKLVSVLVCDIDGLKIINDTLGHAAGDILIYQAAKVLVQICPINSHVFRTGGDEFLVFIEKILPENYLDDLHYSIKKCITSYNCHKTNVPLSMSIGFAVSSDELSSFLQVTKKADFNMYQEKRSCKEKVYQSIRTALLEKN
jgi:diguanylate cyclase (GGDEF)-like protein